MAMKQAVLYCVSDPDGQPLCFAPDTAGVENELITVYPGHAHAAWEGFGAALTGAAGAVYAQMTDGQRRQLMQTYFSPEKMGYDRVRIHLDSCDFCPEMYEADGDADDAELTRFDFSQTERLILPMLRDAESAAGRPLKLMLSPWSPPAYMKSNGQRCGGGTLLPQYYGRWAEYLCRYITEFQRRGFLVQRISLQNEAKAVQAWDSCVYTPAQEKAFLKVMHASLVRHGLNSVEIFIWDHNKERAYERAAAVLDDETAPMVRGVACHWYSGDHFENLDLLRADYPDLRLIISESCIEYSKYGSTDSTDSAVRLAHELLGDMNHGVTAFYDWNLLLNQNGGPNHKGNLCHAPFLYDVQRRILLPQLLQRYFFLFSHFVTPGAVRLTTSRYTDRCDAAAYLRTDEKIAVLLLNRTQATMPVCLRVQDEIAPLSLAPQEMAVCLLENA